MKNYFIPILTFLLFITFKSYSKDNQKFDDDTNFYFEAIIDSNKWQAKIAYYESSNNNLIITAISPDFSKMYITIKGFVPGQYKIDNSTIFNTEDFTFVAQDGKITFNEMASGYISGNFSFDAVCNTDSSKILKIVDGKFNMVKAENQINIISNKITKTKEQIIDVNAGTSKIENNQVEITLSDNTVSFSYKNKPQKSFTVNISKVEKNMTGNIYFANDTKIDYIYVDIFKDNKTTIFFKNGNTSTFF